MELAVTLTQPRRGADVVEDDAGADHLLLLVESRQNPDLDDQALAVGRVVTGGPQVARRAVGDRLVGRGHEIERAQGDRELAQRATDVMGVEGQEVTRRIVGSRHDEVDVDEQLGHGSPAGSRLGEQRGLAGVEQLGHRRREVERAPLGEVGREGVAGRWCGVATKIRCLRLTGVKRPLPPPSTISARPRKR